MAVPIANRETPYTLHVVNDFRIERLAIGTEDRLRGAVGSSRVPIVAAGALVFGERITAMPSAVALGSLAYQTVVLGTTTKPKPEYFGLLVGKAPIVGGTPAAHDGSFKAQAVSAHHAGKGYAVISATVTLFWPFSSGFPR